MYWLYRVCIFLFLFSFLARELICALKLIYFTITISSLVLKKLLNVLSIVNSPNFILLKRLIFTADISIQKICFFFLFWFWFLARIQSCIISLLFLDIFHQLYWLAVKDSLPCTKVSALHRATPSTRKDKNKKKRQKLLKEALLQNKRKISNMSAHF